MSCRPLRSLSHFGADLVAAHVELPNLGRHAREVLRCGSVSRNRRPRILDKCDTEADGMGVSSTMCELSYGVALGGAVPVSAPTAPTLVDRCRAVLRARRRRPLSTGSACSLRRARRHSRSRPGRRFRRGRRGHRRSSADQYLNRGPSRIRQWSWSTGRLVTCGRV